MPKSKTATDVADEPGSKHQTALKPVPKGAVYGFDFPFDGKAEHPHPGIVISSKVGKRGGVDKIGIIALAITHSEQETSWRNLTAVSVPDEEKQRMGLDAQKQCLPLRTGYCFLSRQYQVDQVCWRFIFGASIRHFYKKSYRGLE